MPEHGEYDSHAKKWYCGYWMNEEEWFDIHDYALSVLHKHNAGKEPKEEVDGG